MEVKISSTNGQLPIVKPNTEWEEWDWYLAIKECHNGSRGILAIPLLN